MQRITVFTMLFFVIQIVQPGRASGQYSGEVLVLDTAFAFCAVDLYAYDYSSPEDSSDFTVEGWVYVPDHMNIMIGLDGSRGNDSLREWKIIVGGYQPFQTSHSVVMQFEDFAANTVAQYGSYDEMVLNAWNHFAVVQNGPSLFMYVNGKLSATYTTKQNLWGMTTLAIGSSTGRFDRMRIWSTARSAGQITGAMVRTISDEDPAGLVAEYNFENTYGIRLYDAKEQYDVVPENDLGADFTNEAGLSWRSSNASFIHSVLNIGASTITQSSSDSAYIHWADDGKSLALFTSTVGDRTVRRTQRTWRIYGTFVPRATFLLNPTKLTDLDASKAILIIRNLVDSTTTVHQPSLNSGGYLEFHPDLSVDSLFDLAIGEYPDSMTSADVVTQLTASLGYGPFIQTDDNVNTFTLKGLPASANSVVFKIVRINSYDVVDSLTYSSFDADSVSYSYQMGDLPVDVMIQVDVYTTDGLDIRWVEPLSIIESKPRILASDNFGGYALGTDRTVTYTVDSLPPQTKEVTMFFVDAHGSLLSHRTGQNVSIPNRMSFTGDSLTSASWTVGLDSMDLTLSAQLAVTVKHVRGLTSGTTYYLPLSIQAQRLSIASINGFGPFHTNGYSMRGQSGPTISSRYSVGPLPPRTSKIVYTIVNDADSVLWADSVSASGIDTYLDSSQTLSSAVQVTQLPPKELSVQAMIYADGAPSDGLLAVAPLTLIPQPPFIQLDTYTGIPSRNLQDGTDSVRTVQSFYAIPSQEDADSIAIEFLDVNGTAVLDTVVVYDPFFYDQPLFGFDFSTLPYTVDSMRVTAYADSIGLPSSRTVHLGVTPPRPRLHARFSPERHYYRGQHLHEIFSLDAMSGELDKISLIIGSDTLSAARNSAPYHHFVELDSSYVVANRPAHSFTFSLWMRTTSTDDQGIVGATITDTETEDTLSYAPLLYMRNGRLYATLFDHHDIVTPVRFNDGDWHHVVVSFDAANKLFSLWADGGLVSTIDVSSGHTFSRSGYAHAKYVIGKGATGSVATTLDVPGPFFVGSMTEFASWNMVADVGRVTSMYQGSDLRDINSFVPETYLPFELPADTTQFDPSKVLDVMTSTQHPIMGACSWRRTDVLSAVRFAVDMSALSIAGTDSVTVLVESGSAGSTAGRYTWPLIVLANPSTALFSVGSSVGFGPFYEGMDVPGTITSSIGYVADEEYGRCYVSFLLPDGNRIALDTVEYEKPDTLITSHIDLGEAVPGAKLELVFDFEYGIPEVRRQDTVIGHVLARPLDPPSVAGNTGPFKQAIADGTMTTNNTFTITSFVNGAKFKASFYNGQWEKIDSVWATQSSDSTWLATFDMARLWPPTSYMVVHTLIGSNPEPVTRDTVEIAVTATRPAWFADPDVEFSDVTPGATAHSAVHFVVRSKLGRPMISNDQVSYSRLPKLGRGSETGARYQFSVPKSIPFLGEMLFLTDYPDVTVPLVYYPGPGILDLDDQSTKGIKIQTNSFWSGPGVDPIGLVGLHEGFNVGVEDNNLFVRAESSFAITPPSALLKLIGAGGAGGAGSPLSILLKGEKAFEGLNPGGLYVTIVPTITIGGAFRTNIGVDTASSRWGAIGELDLSGNNVETSDKSSYNITQLGVGLTFGIGYQLMFGTVAAEADFTARFVLSTGKAYVTVPQPRSRSVTSTGFQLYAQVVVKAFWGLASYSLWGPDMLWHYEFGDAIPVTWPHPSDPKWLVNAVDGSSGKSGSATQQSTGNYPPPSIPTTHPQVATDDAEGGSVIAWLEQNSTQRMSTLKISVLPKEPMTFSQEIDVQTSHNAISHPRVVMMNDTLAVVTWMQSRLSSLEGTALLSIQDMFHTLDIWYAVVDLAKGSVLHVRMIEDDLASARSGRLEGSPDITALDEESAIIAWIVADTTAKSSDVHFVSVDVSTGNHSSAAVAAHTDGVDQNIRLAGKGSGNVLAAWIHKSHPEAIDPEIVYTEMLQGTFQPSRSLRLPAGNHVNELDIAERNGIAAMAMTCVDHTSEIDIVEYLSIVPFENGSFDARSAVRHDAVNRTIRDPHLHVTADGRVAATYRAVNTAATVGDTISQIDAVVGDLAIPRLFRHHIAHTEICDHTSMVHDADGLLVDDNFVLFSHEVRDPYVAHEPVNGKLFGAPSMNLVMRAMTIDQFGILRPSQEDSLFGSGNTTGVAEGPAETRNMELLVAPNPVSTQGVATLTVKEETLCDVRIVDLRGGTRAVLFSGSVPPGTHRFQLDTGELENGAYILQVRSADVIRSRSILVIR